MCWNLRYDDGRPKSFDTAGLDSTSLVVSILKTGLQPGDMMLRAKDKVPAGTGGHSVLFVRWGEAARTTYWTYEEAGTKSGTVTKRRNYGHDQSGGFRPYRYKGIDPDFADVLERVSGLDRYETAAAAVEKSFPSTIPTSVPAVVIASGENWPDAVGGAALAGAYGGPLLLTARGSLPPATRAVITRLKPKKVFILGGTSAVSAAVKSQIASMTLPATVPVTRISGSDRYEVSEAIARVAVVQTRLRKLNVDTAYLATGSNFPDALAASPISARTRRPILLTRRDELPEGTLETLQELHVGKVVILGGTASVSAKVASKLISAGVAVTRIDGRDRYQTAISIADHGVALKNVGMGMFWNSLGLASGESFADALSGGVAQGQSGSGALLLLTRGDRLPDCVAGELRQHRTTIVRLRVFGGSAAIEQSTRASAAAALRP